MKQLLKYQWTLFIIGWTVFTGSVYIVDTFVFPISIPNLCILFWFIGILQMACSHFIAKQKQFLKPDFLTETNKHKYYEILFNIADDTIFIMDISGTILMVNNTGANRINKSVNELIGANAFDLLPEKTRQLRKKKFESVVNNKKAVRFTDDRHGIVFDQIMSPVFDHNGNVKCVAVYARDITELKEVEKDLKKAQASAEQANNAKSLLLTHVSHELRTPLNVILGYAQILNGEILRTDEQKKDIALIHKNAEYLIDLIDDIFDISSIEASRMSLSIQPFPFIDFLSTLPDIVSIYKQDKDIDFQYHYDRNLPKWIKGDSRRLRQILLNLLVNAFKFTDKGHIFFSVIKQEKSIEFRIEDTGIGIPKDSMSQIFEPFCRLTNKSTGAGLGLNIAKLLLEQMGGKIQVESTEGKGSSFWFNLIFETVDVKEQSLTPEIKKDAITSLEKTKSILIVDDLADNRAILSKMLEPLGFDIKEADSGESALDLFPEFKPDVMLVDLIMPGINGFELIQQVKMRYPDSPVKAIAISASFTNYSDNIIPEEVDGYMSKPVRKTKLIEEISKHIHIKWKSKNIQNNINTKEPSLKKSLKRAELPDKRMLEHLIDLANHGDLSGIKKEIRLIENHPDYSLFMKQINIFLSDFNFDALVDYIQFINQSTE
ncbi:ATPase [Candidatus Magnetomorum sp. HK-1]|nr:ATPase [Candidatus Magnetomorum sp. HK-1]